MTTPRLRATRAHLEIRQNRVRFVMCAARERGLELLQLVHGGGLQHEGGHESFE